MTGEAVVTWQGVDARLPHPLYANVLILLWLVSRQG